MITDDYGVRATQYVIDVWDLIRDILQDFELLEGKLGSERIKSPAQLWSAENLPDTPARDAVGIGVNSVFALIRKRYDRQLISSGSGLNDNRIYRDRLSRIIDNGEWLASSSCESKDVRSALCRSKTRLDEHQINLEPFGATSEIGKGRRLRMELLAAGWQALYFSGCRNDILIAGLLRLASVQSALPYGLSYWQMFGLILDHERILISQRMLGNDADLYSIRLHSITLCDRESHPRDSCNEVMTLAQIYAFLQVALTLRVLKSHESKFYLIHSGPDKTNIGTDLYKLRVDAWRGAGLEIHQKPEKDLLELGPSLLGTGQGLGYLGFDESSDPRQRHDVQTEYGCFRIAREALLTRRQKVAKYLDKLKADEKKLQAERQSPEKEEQTPSSG